MRELGFVPFGRDNALKALRADLRRAIMARFAQALKTADPEQRQALHLAIEDEVEREFRRQKNTVAPPDALY